MRGMTATIFLQFCGGCYVPDFTGSRYFFVYSTKLADVHRINSGYLINPQPCNCTSRKFFFVSSALEWRCISEQFLGRVCSQHSDPGVHKETNDSTSSIPYRLWARSWLSPDSSLDESLLMSRSMYMDSRQSPTRYQKAFLTPLSVWTICSWLQHWFISRSIFRRFYNLACSKF